MYKISIGKIAYADVCYMHYGGGRSFYTWKKVQESFEKRVI